MSQILDSTLVQGDIDMSNLGGIHGRLLSNRSPYHAHYYKTPIMHQSVRVVPEKRSVLPYIPECGDHDSSQLGFGASMSH